MLIRHSAVEHRSGYVVSRIIGLVCEGKTVGKVGEVDEMGESAGGECQVRQRARRDTWMTIVLETQRCA